MLHPILTEKLMHNDLKLLYQSGVKMSMFDTQVRNQVKSLRQQWRDTSRDDLATKAETLGKQGTTVTRGKRTFTTGGWMESKIQELLRTIYEEKRVPDQFHGELRSIEFECVFKTAPDIDAFVKEVRKAGLQKSVTVKHDGSLRPNENDRNGQTREVVLTYRKGEEAKVEAFSTLIVKRAYVNKSCGTHVHFDMRGKTSREVQLLGNRLARCVNALRMILPQSRRDNEYCRNAINTFNGGNRYCFVNLQAFGKHNTIEVRGHSGTLDSDKILKWIDLCERIMTTRIRRKRGEDDSEIRQINTPDELIQAYKPPQEIEDYIKTRAARFAADASAF